MNLLRQVSVNWKPVAIVIIGIVLVYLLYFSFIRSNGHVHVLGLFKKQVSKVIDSQNKRRINFQNQMQKYYQEIRDFQLNRKKRSDAFKRLARMFRDGVPDTYDEKGNKVKGIAPNPQKAIKYFQNAIKNGFNSGLYELAKIFHYGMHNLEPQIEHAIKLYNHFLKSTSDVLLQNRVMDKIRDAREKLREQSVYKWLNLPVQNQRELNNSQKTQNLGISRSLKPTPKVEPIDIDIQALVGNFADTFEPMTTTVTATSTAAETDNANAQRVHENATLDMETQFYNDAHNVHDSGITATIKKSINNLQKTIHQPKSVETSLHEIRTYIHQLTDNDKKKDALSALDSIERSMIPLSSTNLKEVDALNLVWSRIHQPINDQNKDTLKENLYNELADCIEHDKPVCSTGKFTRILDTLNVVDPEVTIKPGYILQKEMIAKAGKVQQDMMKNLNSAEKALINSATENEMQMKFLTELRKNIENELRKDYVTAPNGSDNGVLTEQHFQRELQKWINEI